MSVFAEYTVAGLALADEIRPMLAGHGPPVQGAALVKLVSLWLAGHPEAGRREVLAKFAVVVETCAAINAKALRDGEETFH